MSKIVVLLGFLLLFFGCKTSQILTEKKVEDYQRSRQEITRIDSIRIFERDSIFVKIGKDTVWMEKYVYRFRDRVRIDTAYSTDTVILKSQEFITKIDKPPLWGRIGNALIWLVIGVVIGFLLKIILKFIV